MRRAFTLVELMVVVLVIGVLAVFTVPRFTMAINRSRARIAKSNIAMIHAANVFYKARTDLDISGALATINTTLGLKIVANGVTYTCNGVTCQATGTGFTVTVTLADPLDEANTNLSCSGTSCPP